MPDLNKNIGAPVNFNLKECRNFDVPPNPPTLVNYSCIYEFIAAYNCRDSAKPQNWTSQWHAGNYQSLTSKGRHAHWYSGTPFTQVACVGLVTPDNWAKMKGIDASGNAVPITGPPIGTWFLDQSFKPFQHHYVQLRGYVEIIHTINVDEEAGWQCPTLPAEFHADTGARQWPNPTTPNDFNIAGGQCPRYFRLAPCVDCSNHTWDPNHFRELAAGREGYFRYISMDRKYSIGKPIIHAPTDNAGGFYATPRFVPRYTNKYGRQIYHCWNWVELPQAPVDAGWHGITKMRPGFDFLEYDNCFDCQQDYIFVTAQCGGSENADVDWVDDWNANWAKIYRAVVKGEMMFNKVANGPVYPGNEAFKALNPGKVYVNGHSWGPRAGQSVCYSGKFVDCDTSCDKILGLCVGSNIPALTYFKMFCGYHWHTGRRQMVPTTVNHFIGFNNPATFADCCDCATTSGGDVGSLQPGCGGGAPPPGGGAPPPGGGAPPGPCGPPVCPADNDDVLVIYFTMCPGGQRKFWIPVGGVHTKTAWFNRSNGREKYFETTGQCFQLNSVIQRKWKDIKNKTYANNASKVKWNPSAGDFKNMVGNCTGETC